MVEVGDAHKVGGAVAAGAGDAFAEIVRHLLAGRRPVIRSNGTYLRDYLYVKDAVEMTLHFAEAGSGAGGLFNLGSGEANTWLTLARAIFAASSAR